MAKNMHGFSAEQMVKMMLMKKLRGDGTIPDVDGLDDIDIPPEHDELLGGLAKLFKTADKNYLTLAELREFVSRSVNPSQALYDSAQHNKSVCVCTYNVHLPWQWQPF